MDIAKNSGESKARWVRVSVEMLSHPALDHGPFDRRSAWLWLITNAAVRDKTVNHKGKPFPLKRGQVLAGRAYLASVWNWSEKQVRLFLELLASENMIEKGQSSGHFTNVLTISNYAKYQDVQTKKDQSKGQSGASAGPVQGQTVTGSTYITNSTLSEEKVCLVTEAAREESAPRQADPNYEKVKAAFNGSTERMLIDIRNFDSPYGTRERAIQWLAVALDDFGLDATLAGYRMLTDDLAKGKKIQAPLRLWATSAQTMASNARQAAAKAAELTPAQRLAKLNRRF